MSKDALVKVLPWLLWIVTAHANFRGTCIRARIPTPPSELSRVNSTGSILVVIPESNRTIGMGFPSRLVSKRSTTPLDPLTRFFSRSLFRVSITCAPILSLTSSGISMDMLSFILFFTEALVPSGIFCLQMSLAVQITSLPLSSFRRIEFSESTSRFRTYRRVGKIPSFGSGLFGPTRHFSLRSKMSLGSILPVRTLLRR
mmetsp:Transcript_12871/g.32423  ORF Transcript_12871/g.32423 Transcript_12871/m.32423 type:complete len:200 (+) Transcript_12871:243-842(+)